MLPLWLKNSKHKLGLIPFIRKYFTTPRKHHLSFRQVLNYRPKHFGLFQLAVTHKSADPFSANQPMNNERLEYLGDAILNAVIAEHLYHNYPGRQEGFLTKMRAKIVSRDTLNDIARQMGLNRLMICRLEEQPGSNLLGNALEAVVGAIFLDAGFKKTRRYIIDNLLQPYINLREFECLTFDYKSQLIEWSQKNDIDVTFEDLEQPDGDIAQTVFVSRVKLHDQILGKGRGHSKKEAQQKAAKEAFDLYIQS